MDEYYLDLRKRIMDQVQAIDTDRVDVKMKRGYVEKYKKEHGKDKEGKAKKKEAKKAAIAKRKADGKVAAAKAKKDLAQLKEKMKSAKC